MSEYKAGCGCLVHVAQWTTKRKLVSVKYCSKHSGKETDRLKADLVEALEALLKLASAGTVVNSSHMLLPSSRAAWADANVAARMLLRRHGKIGGKDG